MSQSRSDVGSSDALSPEQFYHGTATNPQIGDVIAPVAQKTWMKPTYPYDTDRNFAYATTDLRTAWHWAERSWHNRSAGVPKVFRVEPLGEHEQDPGRTAAGDLRGNYSSDRRSRHGWRVVEKMSMPEDMGPEEDWR